MLAASQELDDIILSFMLDASDDVSKQQKSKSLLKKYWTFCLDTQVTKIFPLTFIQMCRYTIWLSQNNIGSWESGQTYLNAIRQLAIALHQPDPVNDEEAWDVLRKRYKERITVSVKSTEKVAIHLQQYEALTLDAIRYSSPRRIELMAQDCLHMFTAIRVGHTAPKVASRPKHVLNWEHIKFMPDDIDDLDDCTEIFIHIVSTKVRQKNAKDDWWTSFGKLDDTTILHMCPVRWFIMHYKINYLQNEDALPTDTVFKTKKGKPLNRTTYTKELRERLQRSIREQLHQPDYEVKSHSGISWRKASLAQLVGYISDSRAANHADHADIETTRSHYAKDTVSQRAANSRVIGSYAKRT
jgi:hypothetical protein